jgi:transmembrane sensor
VGEQKHVTLPDGTQVFLDTDTRIRAVMGKQARTVTLDKGRASFRINTDPACPFIVDAAACRVVAARREKPTDAAQDSFDIRRDGEMVSVVVVQGQATVAHLAEAKAASQAPPAGDVLEPGDRAVVTAAATPQLDRPNLAPLLAWQSGQAIFENQTLAEAVKEMNRYSTVKLAVMDPNLADLRLSGVYRMGDNVAFARSVATLLRADMRHVGDELQLVSR